MVRPVGKQCSAVCRERPSVHNSMFGALDYVINLPQLQAMHSSAADALRRLCGLNMMRIPVPSHSQRHGLLRQAVCAPCQHRHRQQRAWQIACHHQQAGKQVVIVGAGVGGICLAGRLARRGFDVTVVEKNGHVSRAHLACMYSAMLCQHTA